MNKKILTTIVVLFIILVAAGLFALLRKTPAAPQAELTQYTISVTENKGSVSGVVSINGNSTNLSESGVAQYALVSFNTPRDVIWVECPTGYSLSSPTSATGNKINTDTSLNASNITLNSGQQNTLAITCTKQ